MTRLPVAYVLPLRWQDDKGLDELTTYLAWLQRQVDVTVVDGSAPALFTRHGARWAGFVRHVPPDADLGYANGKVNGVVTGLRLAQHEHVVIADDDVRYDRAGLESVHRLLSTADLVRPQNFFAPLPWHARWDTARSLLNRVAGGDYPGTLGVRRSTFEAVGGYDGDVLFENLELIRTIRAGGGVEAGPADLYVRRLPPDAGRFWAQRVRQAYDDLAQPMRMAAFLSVLPAVALAVRKRRPERVLAAAVVAIAVAETGRRRGGGTRVFPAVAALMAPVWVMERGVCSWIALAMWASGRGVRYGDRHLRTAANTERALNRRLTVRRSRPRR
jgi:hypothetical protein